MPVNYFWKNLSLSLFGGLSSAAIMITCASEFRADKTYDNNLTFNQGNVHSFITTKENSIFPRPKFSV